MKKVNLFGAILLMAMGMLTSCLGEGSNQQSGMTVGVLEFDLKTMQYVLKTPLGRFYSSQFNSPDKAYQEGACFYMQFNLNLDLPENATDVVNANKFQTVDVLWQQAVDRYSMTTALSDTSVMLPGEIKIVDPAYSLDGYVDGIFFMQHAIEEPEDQKYRWEMSYDTQNMVTEENGIRVYDVFIRGTLDGSADTKTPTRMAVPNAYDMEYFLESAANTEKSLQKSNVNIRFNYVSEIKDGKMKWAKTKNTEMGVDWILAEEEE